MDKNKLQKIVAITNQDLDDYGAEVASLCVLENISLDELKMIEKRVYMLDDAIKRVIKENE